jgi:hypothetical protein
VPYGVGYVAGGSTVVAGTRAGVEYGFVAETRPAGRGAHGAARGRAGAGGAISLGRFSAAELREMFPPRPPAEAEAARAAAARDAATLARVRGAAAQAASAPAARPAARAAPARSGVGARGGGDASAAATAAAGRRRGGGSSGGGAAEQRGQGGSELRPARRAVKPGSAARGAAEVLSVRRQSAGTPAELAAQEAEAEAKSLYISAGGPG